MTRSPAGAEPRRWLGVDVGAARKGFDAAVVDERTLIALERHLTQAAVLELVGRHRPALVAIDSPRRCAPAGRTARPDELALNRRVCGIRWTPDAAHLGANPYYGWIVAGLSLFEAVADLGADAIEVFPTASWTRWVGARGGVSRARWSRRGLELLDLDGVPARTGQDARDAIAAAVTARLHSHGLTESIGEIVVPRAAPPHGVRTRAV